MGTQPIPESKPPASGPIRDRPRTGPIMWLLLAGLLIPPAVVTFMGNAVGGIEHQRLWVLLLGLPIPVILLSLPRAYSLDAETLTVHGLLYRLRVPRQQVRAVTAISAPRALLHPGSTFCSDPGHALRIERAGRMDLIISPRDPAPFLALDPRSAQTGSGAHSDDEGV